VSVCVVGIAIVAVAMAIKGWHQVGLALGGTLVLIAAVMIFQVWRAVNHLCRQSADLRMAAVQAEQHYADVLQRIVRFVEAREPYAKGHSERVGRLARKMGAGLDLPSSHCELLDQAGQLHDIGLLAIGEGILSKHSSLGMEELRIVQKHSEISYEILKPLESLRDVLPAVRYHH